MAGPGIFPSLGWRLIRLYARVNVKAPSHFPRRGWPLTWGDDTAAGGAILLIRFIVHALASALGFWVASQLMPRGVVVDGLGSLLAAGVLLGVVNALVRPVLVILTFPLTLLTLGLFLLVVNGLMVGLVTVFLHGVHIHGLGRAILTAIIISLTGWLASGLIGRARLERRR
jgi:putative membrane protein